MSPAAGESAVKVSDTAAQQVAFRVGDFLLLGALDSIEEITELMAVNPVPGTVDWFLGLGARKGQLLPISDFCGYLGITGSVARHQRLLIIHRAGESFGLVVDDVVGLMNQDEIDRDSAAAPTDSSVPSRLAPLLRAGVSLAGEAAVEAAAVEAAAVVDLTLLLDQKSFIDIEAQA